MLPAHQPASKIRSELHKQSYEQNGNAKSKGTPPGLPLGKVLCTQKHGEAAVGTMGRALSYFAGMVRMENQNSLQMQTWQPHVHPGQKILTQHVHTDRRIQRRLIGPSDLIRM